MTMARLCLPGLMLLLATSGCMHTLNRMDPDGMRGPLAGTRATSYMLGEFSSAAIIGRTFDGERVPIEDRPIYAGLGTMFAVVLPAEVVMVLLNGPAD